MEKSQKIDKYRRNIGIWATYRSKYRHVGDTRVGNIFCDFLGDISPINIGDISEISVKISEIYRDISGYIGNISK